MPIPSIIGYLRSSRSFFSHVPDEKTGTCLVLFGRSCGRRHEPDISKHHQESVLQGKQFLQEKAAESGFSGSIIHWGSAAPRRNGHRSAILHFLWIIFYRGDFCFGHSPRDDIRLCGKSVGSLGRDSQRKPIKKGCPRGTLEEVGLVFDNYLETLYPKLVK
jgi:hypothetical protein